MALSEKEEVRIGRSGSRDAPTGPFRATDVVRQELVVRPKRIQHPSQDFRRFGNRDASARTLYRDPHKPKLRDWRGKKLCAPGFFPPCNPAHRAVVIRMIRPAPGHQHVHIQKVMHRSHGKSASISRVDATVSGARSLPPAKMVAPVRGHRMRWMGAAG